MTIYIAHADADHDAAEALEKFLERRGHFVETDNGEAALRPVTSADVVIQLLSKDLAFAQGRMRLEQRALDAWAEGRLILVKLDHSFAPVGLRDLPALDASFAERRDAAWGEVQQALLQMRAPPPAAAPAPQSRASGAARAEEDLRGQFERSKRRSNVWIWLTPLLMLPGLLALAAIGAIWLANRIGPTPGTLADTVRGVGEFGARFGLPPSVTLGLFALAIALLIAAPIRAMLSRAAQRRHWDKVAEEHPEIHEDYEGPVAPKKAEAAAPPASEAVFVSYARANAPLVMPVIDAAKAQGREFWLDQGGIGAGESWAGEIVRAIRGARGVLVMCSTAAFESDHVKREVYLADRYKKRLVPVFVEDAEPPEDFEYFFAGVQWLKLHETPEPERPAALLRVLGAS